MNANVTAWNLRHEDFDALPPESRMAFLIRFAVLAPSSHNSQPWKFSVARNEIIITADLSRELPVSDASGRQMYVSLGCAIENIVLAADYYGFRATVERTKVGGQHAWHIAIDGEPLPVASRRVDHLATRVTARVTNRNAYDARMPDERFIAQVRAAGTESLSAHFIDAEPQKSATVKIVSDAIIAAMDSGAFREELSRYIRNNVTKEMTGMPMFGFGMPTPISFLAPFIVRRVNVNRLRRAAEDALLRKHTPMFVVFATPADDIDAWLAAGRAYQRIALEAGAAGLSTAPLAAGIEIGDAPKKLQALLGTTDRPQVFFRIGYAKSSPAHSPRLPADRVIIRK